MTEDAMARVEPQPQKKVYIYIVTWTRYLTPEYVFSLISHVPNYLFRQNTLINTSEYSWTRWRIGIGYI